MENNSLEALIAQYLNKDVTLAEQMLQLIELERHALETHDAEKLALVIDDKSKLILEMNKNQALRDKIQISQNLPKGMEGFKDLLASFSEQKRQKLEPITDKLTKILIKIKDLSNINQKLIGLQNSQITRVLNAMHGVNSEGLTYGKSAQAINGLSGQSLTKA